MNMKNLSPLERARLYVHDEAVPVVSTDFLAAVLVNVEAMQTSALTVQVSREEFETGAASRLQSIVQTGMLPGSLRGSKQMVEDIAQLLAQVRDLENHEEQGPFEIRVRKEKSRWLVKTPAGVVHEARGSGIPEAIRRTMGWVELTQIVSPDPAELGEDGKSWSVWSVKGRR